MSAPIRRLLLALLLGLGLLTLGSASTESARPSAGEGSGGHGSGDRIIERGVLVDPGGTLRIEDVAARRFAAFEGTFSGGFTRSVHWFRIVVRAEGKHEALALRIRPTVLDELTLHEAGEGPPGAWTRRTVGDRHPFDARDRPSAALGFIVRPSDREAVYYLRLQTTSVSTFRIEALAPEEANRRDHALDTLQLLFAGLMLWPLMWALQNWFTERDPLVGIFAFHHAVYILYGLSVTGYFAPLGPPGFIDRATSVLVCLVAFTGSLFARGLLRGGDPPKSLAIGLDLLLAVFPLQLLAMLAGRTELALALNVVLVLSSRWYFVLVAACLRNPEARPGRRFLLVAMLVLALLATALLPASLGWSPLRDLMQRDSMALTVFGLASTSLFVALLHARLSEQRAQARRNELELILTRRALELEQSLKQQAERQASTDDLTRLYNRRHFVELAEREILRAERYQNPLTLLMLDIDHFKRVNDTWGHEAGDRVLRSVAQALQGALREVDVLARIGGEEFAILLVETSEVFAEQVAERIRTTVEGSPIALADDTTVTVTVSIGLAGLSAARAHLDALMREADLALYAAKSLGRNRVARAPDA